MEKYMTLKETEMTLEESMESGGVTDHNEFLTKSELEFVLEGLSNSFT